MGWKKKKLKKIGGLERQRDKHFEKIKSYIGKNEFLLDYWEGEIKRFDKEIEKEKKKLEK